MSRKILAAWRGPSTGIRGWVLLFLRLALGGVFLSASIDKILHPRLFAEAIAAYRLLPEPWIPWVAVVLPWTEAATGFLLLAGVWVDGAALLAIGMLAVFMIGIGSAMARGLEIDCGCFSFRGDSPVGIRRLAEDLLLLLAAGAVLIDRRRGETVSRRCTPDRESDSRVPSRAGESGAEISSRSMKR